MSKIILQYHLQMTFSILPLALAVFLSWPDSSYANDSTSAVGVGGLVLTKSKDIRLQDEILRISPNRVHVEYQFLNESSEPIDALVAFPMPPIAAPSSASWVNTASFDDFAVVVDGKTVAYRTESTVSKDVRCSEQQRVGEDYVFMAPLIERYHQGVMGSRDLTSELLQHGVTTAQFPDFAKLPEKTQDWLLAKGYYSNENIDGERLATYCLHRTYVWEQVFPPQQVLHVVHDYRPVLGMHQFTHRHDDPDALRVYTDAMYVLSTGSNWKNGIEKFHFEVDGSPAISVDMDGVRYSDIGSLELERRAFKPQGEIHVVFLPAVRDLGRLEKTIDGLANCRSAPAATRSIVRSISDGEKVVIEQRQGDWYQLVFADDGQASAGRCWTHKRNLK